MNAAPWRSPDNYPDPARTGLDQWAWEFLRRNPDYRDDWRRYSDCCAALRAKYGAMLETAEREPTDFAFTHHDPLGCVYEPPRRRRENDDRWRRRVGKGSCTPLGVWLCGKWGIRLADGLPDPNMQEFKGLWSSSSKTVRRVTSMPQGSKFLTTSPAIQFDLTRPLEPQIEAAKRELKGLQRYFTQHDPVNSDATRRAQSGTMYSRYIRVLDAIAAEATVTEIGDELFHDDPNPYPDFPRNKRVRAMIHAAEELRDGGYRRLPALADRSGKNKRRR